MGEIERDVAQLEELLRKLEKEYDMFLSGQERKEPLKTEAAVQAILRVHGVRPIQNSTLAFKFNSLAARYNSFRTVWTRRLREREEGRGPGFSRPDKVSPSSTTSLAKAYIARDPDQETQRLEHLFETYRHMRKVSGESTDKLRSDNFQRALAEKIQQLKKTHGVESVLIKIVTEGGKTKIVAKPFRRQPDAPPKGEA